ncbi:PAS/PAC sensor hybrid histidine kinase [Chloroherpeton thalassium ATCC 35110]|uniref:histidine kinase n=1 Tax=Chloroherpeton thalassium (strain ATCC 35110 / GB-78) TaxID=517418 RepID=B3QSM6_CHLT3|nr:PAS domain-containing sensor histidine kinase [Chloroherpeton thalassium]ACF14073.1 PAS/PAC sensor hybrid histidine kinase [Chloroherpeton thalassium ATCC 35110]
MGTAIPYYIVPGFIQNDSSHRGVFLHLLDVVTDPVFIKDDKQTWLYVNDAFCKFFGASYDKVVGKSDDELFPQLAQVYQCHDELVFSSGRARDFEEEFHTFAEKKYRISTRRSLFRDDFGNAVIVGTITKAAPLMTKHMEENSKHPQITDFYRSIFSTVRSGILLIDASGLIYYCNESACEIFGASESAMLGHLITDLEVDFFHEDGHLFSGDIHPVAITLRTGMPCSNVLVGIANENDSTRWVTVDTHLLPTANDAEESSLVVSLTDVTEAKKADEKRIRAANEFKRTIQHANGAIFKVRRDASGQIAYQLLEGQLACEQKITTEQVKGKTPVQVFGNVVGQTMLMNLARAFKGRSLCFQLKLGANRHVFVTCTPIFENGLVSEVVGSFTDITAHKMLELEKHKLSEQLLQSQKMEAIGTLASGIAHDFNNVMSMLIMASEQMSHLAKDEKLLKYIDLIRQATERGMNITKQLLIFSRSRQGHYAPARIGQIVQQIITILEHSLPKTIKIYTDIETQQDLVFGDQGQIYQALLNISINARDAMQKGGKLSFAVFNEDGEILRKRFPNASTDPYLAIKISDTGIGISPEMTDKIFEPFYTTKTQGKGTGLGLAIAKRIVSEHNGFIDIVSSLNAGTSFYIYLPSVLEDEIQHNPQQLPTEGGSETILLVDDESDLRKLVSRILKKYGYEVYEASNGLTGLAAYQKHSSTIDLIVTDLGMPEMDGEEFIRHVKSANENAKVLIVTGYYDEEQISKLLTQNMSVIQKPFDSNTLLKEIRRLLGS